jgi:hypothetical protein
VPKSGSKSCLGMAPPLISVRASGDRRAAIPQRGRVRPAVVERAVSPDSTQHYRAAANSTVADRPPPANSASRHSRRERPESRWSSHSSRLQARRWNLHSRPSRISDTRRYEGLLERSRASESTRSTRTCRWRSSDSPTHALCKPPPMFRCRRTLHGAARKIARFA